jgi:Tol biopolymer transport system component
MPLKNGQVLERRYHIEALLGQGGMGAVYTATDLRFNTTVAIKENLEVTPDSQRQFSREAGLLHQLRHPNLPRVTDYFFIPDQGQYLVMDYVEGEDLKALLARQGPVPEPQALEWIGQVLDALEYLHGRSVIHRDVKPANVKIAPQGQVFLVDFGLAKVYDPDQHTTIGARGVTPGYAPPEQYGQGRTDARSDIYSVGATLYAMLSGQAPPDALQLLVRKEGLIPVRHLNPRVSPQVDAAVTRAMQPTLEDRFQTAAAFRAALLDATTRVSPARPPVVEERPSPPPLPRVEPEIDRRQQVDTLLAQAQASFDREDWTDAEATCTDILALDQQHGAAQDLLQRVRTARQLSQDYAQAKRAVQAGDWETATAALSRVLALDSSYRDARALYKRAETERARQSAEVALPPQERPAPSPAPSRPLSGVGQRIREGLAGLLDRRLWQSPRFLAAAILVVLVAVTIGVIVLFSGPGGEEIGGGTPVPPEGEGTLVLETGEGILFTSNRDGKRDLYRLRGGQVERVTHTPGPGESWAPVWTPTGILFTSDRDGKRDLYRLSGGMVERVTNTPGDGESWSPAWGPTGILFTSDRDGKRDLYRLSGGMVERVTNTPGEGESWSPVWTETGILFTSDRDGNRDLYRLSGGKVERVTHTAGGGGSWSPTWSPTGILFTSDRDGKRDLYRLHLGQVERVTNTPGGGESWSPSWTETGILLTSDRDGKREIYRLSGGEVERVTDTPGRGESWLPDRES